VNPERTEIRLAGEGGQGMILAGIILAEAAAIYDGKNVVQSQSYGPEARGGASRSEVIISEAEIDFPEVIVPNVLVALSQMACDKYAANLTPDGLLIVDEDKVKTLSYPRAIHLPVSRLATEVTGKTITANTVALGILVGLTGVVSRPAIQQAVNRYARALQAGFEQAEKVLRSRQDG
jgi:2-oxoglutarate ferredoxin oxidoreductase subunit gamma